MKNFNYRCKKCESINSLSPDWFKDNVEKKIHSCVGCGNKIQLNVQKIRHDLYNDFKTATELVTGKTPKITDVYLKINVNEEHKRLIKLDSEIIILGRGSELDTEFLIDENQNKYQRINIPDKYVSSRHCRLRLNSKTQKVTIQDLGSLNKTFLEDTEIDPSDELIFKIGTKVRLGTTIIELC